jgi:hypothetical protein
LQRLTPAWILATSTTPSGPSSSLPQSAFVADSPVLEIVLTSAERALLEALNALGVRYLIVGMGAALIEGAPGTTQDLDLWFGQIDEARLREAARRAGGLYTSGFGLQPPAVGGEGLDRIDVVLTASGLETFEREFSKAREYDLDGVRVNVLPLERVIASKRAANRPKDSAQIPMLEAALVARSARREDAEGQ